MLLLSAFWYSGFGDPSFYSFIGNILFLNILRTVSITFKRIFWKFLEQCCVTKLVSFFFQFNRFIKFFIYIARMLSIVSAFSGLNFACINLFHKIQYLKLQTKLSTPNLDLSEKVREEVIE